MRRPSQSPRPRTDREKWQRAQRLGIVREALAREGNGNNSIDFGRIRERVERKWACDFAKEIYYAPHAQPSEAEWQRLKRLDPSSHELLKWGVTLTNRIRELKTQAGGDQQIFEALWKEELASLHAEAEKEKAAEWAKVGIKRLPYEKWVEEIRAVREREHNEKAERSAKMSERTTDTITEWLEIQLDSLAAEDRIRLIDEVMDTLTVQELCRIRDTAEEKRLAKLNDAKIALIAEMKRKTEELGLPLEEIFALAKNSAKKSYKQNGRQPVAAKYRSPKGETWSGRGRVPVWLRQLEDEGHDREEFRVNDV